MKLAVQNDNDLVQIIGFQYVPKEDIRKKLDMITRRSYSEYIPLMPLLDAYNYGFICGKRQERQRKVEKHGENHD